MNFKLRNDESLILMSVRKGAPYQDRLEEGGKIIVYEGHDVPRTKDTPDPKALDQVELQPNGRPTQNGLFMAAVRKFKSGHEPERVHVFEKIRNGIWTYNGVFELVDGWLETVGRRQVFKFEFRIANQPSLRLYKSESTVEHDRVIPTSVKLEVWKRDKGCCAKCGNKKDLHFDHVIPYSLGGSSKDAKNIQILCSAHNLAKRDNIE
jgi:hypothetical protein